jgi:hypothetical protein
LNPLLHFAAHPIMLMRDSALKGPPTGIKTTLVFT